MWRPEISKFGADNLLVKLPKCSSSTLMSKRALKEKYEKKFVEHKNVYSKIISTKSLFNWSVSFSHWQLKRKQITKVAA
jgi:hypothetical protein